MQKDRPVRIDDAFRVARSARGIAHRGGSIFLDSREFAHRGMSLDEGSVFHPFCLQSGQSRCISSDEDQGEAFDIVDLLRDAGQKIAICD